MPETRNRPGPEALLQNDLARSEVGRVRQRRPCGGCCVRLGTAVERKYRVSVWGTGDLIACRCKLGIKNPKIQLLIAVLRNTEVDHLCVVIIPFLWQGLSPIRHQYWGCIETHRRE